MLLLRVILQLIPPSFPRIHETRIDLVVLAIAGAIAAASVLLSTLLPALAASRVSLVEVLARAGGTTATRRGGLMIHALIAGQVALSVSLLAAGGVLLLGLYRLSTTDTGLKTTHFVMARVSPGASYDNDSTRSMFWRHLQDEMRRVPGVEWVTGASSPPVTGGPNSGEIQLADSGREIAQPRFPQMLVSNARWRAVLPSYFERLGIRIVRGRDFAESDTPGTPLAVVVNEAALPLFDGVDPIGRKVKLRLSTRLADGVVIGICQNVRESLAREPRAEMFVSVMQRPQAVGTILLGTNRTAASLAPDLKAVAWLVDRDVVLTNIETFEQNLGRQTALMRLRSYLFGGFAALGTLLALIAVASVVAYLVVRRTREVGIRAAIGAQRRHILWLFMRETGVAVLIGLAGGMMLAYNASSLLQGWTYNVGPTEPIVYATIAGLFIVAAATAALIPARRATKIDSSITLRAE